MSPFLCRFVLGFSTLCLALQPTLAADSNTIIWKLEDLRRVGGHATEILGAPRSVAGAAVFDGKADGIFVPAIPIAGARAYTIEVLLNPAADGGKEQRFLHLEDSRGWRALIELRLNEKGGWWLDTHMRMGDADRGLTLIDPQRVYAADRWYWVALRYDGEKMSSFVNGAPELEGTRKFEPFGSGKVSLGVRQNRVYWFKGAIREVRFSREALPAARLQRTD